MAFILTKWFLLALFSFNSVQDPHAAKAESKMHPFYVSVTEVNHNSDDKTLEISCKFFTDDFEITLQNAYKAQLDLSSDKHKASFDKYIPDYIGKRLAFSINGKTVKLNYVGYEKDKESVYCYFEVTNVPSIKSMGITNKLLYDYKQEQLNIMHVTTNGKRQSAKLSQPQVSTVLEF